jgi:hypothetical protein
VSAIGDATLDECRYRDGITSICRTLKIIIARIDVNIDVPILSYVVGNVLYSWLIN